MTNSLSRRCVFFLTRGSEIIYKPKIVFIMKAVKTKIRNRLEEDHLDMQMRIERQRRQSWRVGGSRPPEFGQRGREEIAGGREILLYLIMYRKYVRKW